MVFLGYHRAFFYFKYISSVVLRLKGSPVLVFDCCRWCCVQVDFDVEVLGSVGGAGPVGAPPVFKAQHRGGGIGEPGIAAAQADEILVSTEDMPAHSAS